MPGFPTPRAVSAFFRLVIVALTVLALAKFLPNAHGAAPACETAESQC